MLQEYGNFSDENVNFLEDYGSSSDVEFWHSDENSPFLVCKEVSRMVFLNGVIQVYNMDYENPIITVNEWSFWKVIEIPTKLE